MVLKTLINNLEENRTIYLVVFVVLLIVSIVTTLLIYYFVRYKKKYFFDASGRKFIVSTGEYPNIINQLNEIIQFDNKNKLQEEVEKNSIGFLQLRNDKNQNLLHLCAMYGAKECLMYVKNFEIINLNEKDQLGNIPLFYFIVTHSHDTRINREMFLWLCKGVQIEVTCGDGQTLKSKMNEWHCEMYSKYAKASFVDICKNPEQNLV